MMQLKVKDNGDKLSIENQDNKTTVVVPYDNNKSYLKNILTYFSRFCVVDYISTKDGDIFELKELK